MHMQSFQGMCAYLSSIQCCQWCRKLIFQFCNLIFALTWKFFAFQLVPLPWLLFLSLNREKKYVFLSLLSLLLLTVPKTIFCPKNSLENIAKKSSIRVTYFLQIRFWLNIKKYFSSFGAQNWNFNKVCIGSIAKKKGSTRWYFSTLTHKTLTCPEKKNSVTLILSFNDCST